MSWRALEEARGDRFSRGTTAHFTWSGRSKYIKVTGFHAKTTSARSKMFRLKFEIEEPPQDHFTEVSIGAKTPADLTEGGLRSVLYGEPNPLADQHMGLATEINDPLAPLRENPVSEEIIRPIFGTADDGPSGQHRARQEHSRIQARCGNP